MFYPFRWKTVTLHWDSIKKPITRRIISQGIGFLMQQHQDHLRPRSCIWKPVCDVESSLHRRAKQSLDFPNVYDMCVYVIRYISSKMSLQYSWRGCYFRGVGWGWGGVCHSVHLKISNFFMFFLFSKGCWPIFFINSPNKLFIWNRDWLNENVRIQIPGLGVSDVWDCGQIYTSLWPY